jgi:HSP20 family protein
MQTMQNTQETNTFQKRPEEKPAPRAQLAYVTPAIDVLQSENEVLILADLPGVKAADLDIEFDKDVLHVVGRREAAGYAYKRSFTLSRDIDPESISAELADGVLKLHLPKHPSRRPRAIQVKTT